MKLTPIIIALCLIVGVLAFLQFKGCRAGPSHLAESQRQDSMMRRVADSVRLLQIKADSLILLRKDRVIDSLIPLVNMARNAVNAKGRQIAGTIAQGQEARVLKDTMKILSNCDSLVAEVQTGTRLVGGYEYLTDSLIRTQKAQSRIQDSVVSIRVATIHMLQGSLDSSNARYQSLYQDYTRVQRKAGKRWSVGPGVGVVLIGGQVKGIPVLSVHYDLFKF